ncbi:STAS domain-containing protein [Streptomyces sp. DT24]|uniref:STAS domain-containing protein n=1 Tax=Streptomyces sp. DT24 TaxID=3416520 RepID=UPI003CFBAA59
MSSSHTPENADHSGPAAQALHHAFGGEYALGDTWIVTAEGEVDADNISGLRATLETAAATYPVVILDTSALAFADSSFLNLLVRVHKRTSLRIAAPPPQLRRLLAITGADRALRIYPDVAHATED